MTLQTKNQIREYLYSNTPDNFKAYEYYEYIISEAYNYFGSGHYDTSLAICLFLKENKNQKPTPNKILKFVKSKIK